MVFRRLHRNLFLTRCLLATQCLLASFALAAPPTEWLDIRRKGAPAIAELALQRSAQKPWQRVFKADVPAGHPMAGLKIAVARSFVGHAQLQVRVVAGPAELLGTGVVMDGAKAWLRVGGEKAKLLPHEAVFRPQPILGVPWIMFCALEWQSQYTPTVEGEFDEVAVVRLAPRYELGVTARPAKVSISKRSGYLIATAISDGKGAKLGVVDWEAFNGAGQPEAFQLRGAGDDPKSVRFVAEGPSTAPAKSAFTAGALR